MSLLAELACSDGWYYSRHNRIQHTQDQRITTNGSKPNNLLVKLGSEIEKKWFGH
jgi:hypothetical protein